MEIKLGDIYSFDAGFLKC